MGVYQDEIDNNIQPAIDKKASELALVNEKLSFYEGLASDVTVEQYNTAALASSSAEVNSLGTDDVGDLTDEVLHDYIDEQITWLKVMNGTHPTYTQYKDTTIKGDVSSMKWVTTSLQSDLDALNSKKSAWAAKELDATDTTSYNVVAQPVD